VDTPPDYGESDVFCGGYKMRKNIKNIKVGDQLINASGRILGIVVFRFEENIKALKPGKNNQIPIALTEKGNKVWAKSASGCLDYDNTNTIIDYSSSETHILIH
jgi:hypothetical protein